MSFDTTTTNSSSQPSMMDTVSKHATNAWSGFTGWFKKKDNSSTAYSTQSGGRSKRRRRSKKFYKGKASKTRKQRKDFVTHKGDKYYNRKGHRQSRNAKGTRKAPYKKH